MLETFIILGLAIAAVLLFDRRTGEAGGRGRVVALLAEIGGLAYLLTVALALLRFLLHGA